MSISRETKVAQELALENFDFQGQGEKERDQERGREGRAIK